MTVPTVMSRPRPKESARSPSTRVSSGTGDVVGGMHTVLLEQMLEVIKIETLVVLGLACKGHEEADQEDGDDEDEEG